MVARTGYLVMARASRVKPRHVTILLMTGRKVEIQQERSAFVLISRRFGFFVLGLVVACVTLSLLIMGLEFANWIKILGWFTGTLIAIITIYFVLYLLMNYTAGTNGLIILSPVLSLLGVGVATPIVVGLVHAWIPEDSLTTLALTYFVGGLITAEIGMTTFVYLVRDPLVRRYESEIRRREAPEPVAISIGGEVFPLESLCYLEAENQYIRVHLRKASVLVAGQLTHVERQLAAASVFRPHRSYLVFRGGIASLENQGTGQPVIRTTCGAEIPVARRRVADLRAWLSFGPDRPSQSMHTD